MENWTEKLTVRDPVIVRSSRGRCVDVVTRITKTQITTKHHGRFMKATERIICGTDWECGTRLEAASPERILALQNERKKNALRAELRNTQWGSVSLSTLRAVRNLLQTPLEGEN